MTHTERINPALAAFAEQRELGRCHSHREIADACACLPKTIRQIELTALAKCRKALKRERLGASELGSD